VKVEKVIHTKDTVKKDTNINSAENAEINSYTEKISYESALRLN